MNFAECLHLCSESLGKAYAGEHICSLYATFTGKFRSDFDSTHLAMPKKYRGAVNTEQFFLQNVAYFQEIH